MIKMLSGFLSAVFVILCLVIIVMLMTTQQRRINEMTVESLKNLKKQQEPPSVVAPVAPIENPQITE